MGWFARAFFSNEEKIIIYGKGGWHYTADARSAYGDDVQYVDVIKELRLELAADYLVMAAMLAEIKSRMLLPRPTEDTEEDDPRAELIRRLQEYERFKQAAEDIEALPRIERDFEEVNIIQTEVVTEEKLPQIEMKDMEKQNE